MEEGGESAVVLLGVLIFVYLIWKAERNKPPDGPDDKWLLDDPYLPVVDLRPWGFRENHGVVGFFGEYLVDFPSEFQLGGFKFTHKNSGRSGGEDFFRIYGWWLENMDPDHPVKKYYADPLLKDQRARFHVLVN